MTTDIALQLDALAATSPQPARLRLTFAHACANRVRHRLEDERLIACLDVLAGYLDGRESDAALEEAAAVAATLANRHPGSDSIDGAGHAAVSASYAVAHALAGRAVQAADYAAYATVYGDGGYGAVGDPDAFVPEREWQAAALRALHKATRPGDP